MDSRRMVILVFLLPVLVSVTRFGAEGGNYNANRTCLIDMYPPEFPKNFLFRGNIPIINGSFAYEQITATMASRIKSKGITMPTNFTLIVISYLNIFEIKDLEIERNYFKNSSKGEFYNVMIVGSLIPPPSNNATLIKQLVILLETKLSHLPTLTKVLHDKLTQHKGPALIYTHCEAGTDRTGEVSGAYYLRYLNMTFSEALYIDNHIQNRDMYKSSRNAMQWYCYYLLYKEGFTHLNCTVPSSSSRKLT